MYKQLQKMEFYEIDLTIESDFAEVLLAELAEIGFDSFLDKEDGLLAYITEDLFDERALKDLMERYASKTSLSYSLKKIKKQNWNKEWEDNFHPIDVVGKVYIRADFHAAAADSYSHEIIVVPKMSFGTGHHETTAQMIELQLDIDHKAKSVLDVGTGTGILAIMAHKLGAARIHSFDIDEWSVENGEENYQLNGIDNITIEKGTIDTQKPEVFDIVLANINRNILLDEIPKYAEFTGDYLLVSGFYEHDIADIHAVAEKSGFKKVKHISKNNWAAVVFRK
jgi:ribosomal protein L11 methyltransferase